MKLAQGAARLCLRPRFQGFLSVLANEPVGDEHEAAVVLRKECRIQSRSELNTDPEAGKRYYQLIRQFNDWMNG